MTLSKSHPRARQRWLLLVAGVAALTLLIGGIALATHSGVATEIPSNYFTVEDEQGPNDVPGQVDLTLFGRDDTNPNTYDLVWSWDSISAWTGQGQTGDACALFDTDGDTMINYVVCARVSNLNADPTDVRIIPKSGTESVHLFSCSDKKNDRCTNPTALPSSSISAGPLSPSAANLVTHTDPFLAGESYPHDTTIRVQIPSAVIQGTEVLTNVCSYPSAGNGGNNNPFDCIVTPGGGFIVIVKDAGNGVTSPNFTFDVHRGTAFVAARTIAGSGTASGVPVLVGSGVAKVTETNIPSPWALTNAACNLDNGAGAATGTFSTSDNWVSGITVESGKVTQCTFTDAQQTGTLVIQKLVVNDNGGTKVATDFSYSLDNNVTSTAFVTDPDPSPSDPLKGKNSLSLTAGTSFIVTEPEVAGYATTYSSTGCSGTITAGQTSTCLITNDDIAPSLTLVKTVTNNNGGTAAATDWTLTATGTGASPTNLSDTTPVTSGGTFSADTYTLGETGGPSGYTAGLWSCVVTGSDPVDPVTVTSNQVPVGLGDDITCTINNDDEKASPTGTTIQSWVIHDELTITGLRGGAEDEGDATVTFHLYSDDACSIPVGDSEEVGITSGVAATEDGFAVTETGFYYWIATYSGDSYNNGFSTECGDELTQIHARDAYGDPDRDDLILAEPAIEMN